MTLEASARSAGFGDAIFPCPAGVGMPVSGDQDLSMILKGHRNFTPTLKTLY